MQSRKVKRLLLTLLLVSVANAPTAWGGKWIEHVSDMKVFTNKINELEKKLEHLIEEKVHSREPNSQSHLNGEIEHTYKELRDQYNKYEELRVHMAYEHPEKGDMSERKYAPVRKKTIEDIELELGLQGQLTQLGRKIEEKYAPFREDKSKEKSQESATHTPVQTDPTKQRPVLSK